MSMVMVMVMMVTVLVVLTHCVPLIDLHSGHSAVPHPLLMPRDNPIHTNGMPSPAYPVYTQVPNPAAI